MKENISPKNILPQDYLNHSEWEGNVIGKPHKGLNGLYLAMITVLLAGCITAGLMVNCPDTISLPIEIVLPAHTGERAGNVCPLDSGQVYGRFFLSGSDAAAIPIGLRASVDLERFPKDIFGQLDGKVTHVSFTPSPGGQYEVVVSFPKGLITNKAIQIPFEGRLIGTVALTIHDRSLCDLVLQPLSRIFRMP